MGMNASASLFYGVLMKEKDLLKIAKRVGIQTEEDEEPLEGLSDRFKVKLVCLIREGFEPDDPGDQEWGVAVYYEKVIYDYSGATKIKFPSYEVLDAKWEKVKERLGIKKKPSWLLFADYS